MRMENTKQAKIFAANVNMTSEKNTSQKGSWNRKRNKKTLKVTTTFVVRNENRNHLWGNIKAFFWREEIQGQRRKIFKVWINLEKKTPAWVKDISGEIIAVSQGWFAPRRSFRTALLDSVCNELLHLAPTGAVMVDCASSLSRTRQIKGKQVYENLLNSIRSGCTL